MVRDRTYPEAPPRLDLPDADVRRLRDAYRAARAILEYGAGGTTAMAAEMPGKTIIAVESDPERADRMEQWFAANPPASPVTIHREPLMDPEARLRSHEGATWLSPHRYPLSVWDRLDFAHPDTVLVTGRSRAACLLATLYRASRPVTVFVAGARSWPDRERIADYLRPAAIEGDLARFDLRPQPFPADRMMDVLGFFTRSE